jgi:hypothetical protein
MGRDRGAPRLARAGRRTEYAAGRRLQGVIATESVMAKKIPLTPVTPPARPTDEILADIRQIYFTTTRRTILQDFDRAIDLLKSIPAPEDRQRATVYMDGLAEMRKEFRTSTSPGTSGRRAAGPRKRSGP